MWPRWGRRRAASRPGRSTSFRKRERGEREKEKGSRGFDFFVFEFVGGVESFNSSVASVLHSFYFFTFRKSRPRCFLFLPYLMSALFLGACAGTRGASPAGSSGRQLLQRHQRRRLATTAAAFDDDAPPRSRQGDSRSPRPQSPEQKLAKFKVRDERGGRRQETKSRPTKSTAKFQCFFRPKKTALHAQPLSLSKKKN